MHTAGTGTKITAVLFLVIIVIGGFCTYRFQLIFAVIFPGTGNPRQQEQVNTKYEHNFFHVAKIKNYSAANKNIITTRLQ
jgi:hypothetical protein